MDFQRILDQLSAPDCKAQSVLENCRSQPGIFLLHPELYLPLCEKLISQGCPGPALELGAEGRDRLKSDSRLQYRLAQAANRGGNPRYAAELLSPLLELADGPVGRVPPDMDTVLRVEIISLQGSILKRQYGENRPELAVQSAEYYERAAAVPRAAEMPDAATFPLINAATMRRLAGDEAKSRELAGETIRRLEAMPLSRLEDDSWLLATLGEARMLLGESEHAIEWYRKAVEKAAGNDGDIAAIRRNYRFMSDIGLASDPAFFDGLLGTMVVFSGHLIDSPERLTGSPDRFPNDERLIDAVKEEIRRRLQAMNARVGYCCLAAGGDILFAEAMLELGKELQVVIPFSLNDFLRTSVNFGRDNRAWRRWSLSFYKILQSLPDQNVHYMTTESFHGSEGLWDFSVGIIQGMAILRAREFGTEPKALVLIDRGSAAKAGGAIAFAESWKAMSSEAEEIDLGALRRAHWNPTQSPREQIAAPLPKSNLPRPIKAILFADVVGFSAIPEWLLPDFFEEYSRFLRELFAGPAGQKAGYANTWGDGIVAVFNGAADAADFAAELVGPTDIPPVLWSKFQLAQGVPLRVGLHAGPVFELSDLFQGKPGYVGQHMNRAARIEPICVPGCTYASETFAAMLAVQAGDRFTIEALGVRSLAKEYDRAPLYRVDRKPFLR